jgi:hypothetical protein
VRTRHFSIATLILCVVMQAASAKLVHRWSFDKDGTDSVGGATAKLQDGAAIKEGKVVLDGQNNWVDLPIGKTIEKLKSVTIETWVTAEDMQGAWSRVFDFGTGPQANMFFTPRNANPPEGDTANKPRLCFPGAS